MLVIIDYGVGNLNSIQNMVKRGGNSAIISNDKNVIEEADKILLPGMGHFDNCMSRLNHSNLLPIIEKKILQEKVPVLGICVGLQMLMESSEEGKEKGLGWIMGKTVQFQRDKMNGLKVPNMGWLDVQPERDSKLWQGLKGARFYFAHSYHVQPESQADILLTTKYGYSFSVGIEHGNILGVQFHPEKSHRFGMQLLRNFVELY